MSSCRSALAAALSMLALAAVAQPAGDAGIGRAATPTEIAAWDIDVRPDFKGLPKGAGSVAAGMAVWEAKCASCHGVFGESNEVFSPIVGGTTQADLQSGRVARLTDAAYPGRTTLMKLATVSTLWDYIKRAMPWAQPKSLTTEEVYAVTAYILNMGGIVKDDFTLSDRNIADVQRLLPNRSGLTDDHAMWPGATMKRKRPDVSAAACMKDCPAETRIASSLPDFARNAHGNLAEQNRWVGAQRGSDTTKPPAATLAQSREFVFARRAASPASIAEPAATATPAPQRPDAAAAFALAQKNSCTACHAMEARLVGPSFRDIAQKHGRRADAVSYLAARIQSGGSGVWGSIPMPPQALGEDEAKTIARWLAADAGN